MRKLKYGFFSIMLALVMTLSLFSFSSAESENDLEALFREMDIETLEETSTLLLTILNEKKVENAKLILEPAESTVEVKKNIKLSVSADGRENGRKVYLTRA